MKSCKCSKTELQRILAKVLKTAPAKAKENKTQSMKKVKLEVVATMRKT